MVPSCHHVQHQRHVPDRVAHVGMVHQRPQHGLILPAVLAAGLTPGRFSGRLFVSVSLLPRLHPGQTVAATAVLVALPIFLPNHGLIGGVGRRRRRRNGSVASSSDARRRAEHDAQLDAPAREPQAPQASPRPTRESPRAPGADSQSRHEAPKRKSLPESGTGAARRPFAKTLIIIAVVFVAVIEIIGGLEAQQLLSQEWGRILFLIMWLGTLIWFARWVSWRRYRNGGDRLIVKIGMPLFMLYIACRFSIYEAPQPQPPGTVLRFDNQGNLIQIMPGTTPVDLATVEHDSWRSEWWCAEPVPGVNEWLNYNEQATIKCNNQGSEWCVNRPAGPREDYEDPGADDRNNCRRVCAQDIRATGR